MADANELELDLSLDDETENITNRANERITNLSSKVRDTAKERDDATAKAEAEAQARQEAEKERDFFKDFSGISAKYEGAPEYQEQIWEKVKSGYSVEDATVSVLNAEGKFTPAATVIEASPAAGGSAVTPPLSGAEKALDEMTRDEKRAQLQEAERTGELAKILARGL